MASIQRLQDVLLPKLSQGATITANPPSRWSTYKAPKPIGTVNVSSEADVAVTVQFCNDHNLSFLAQNGGNGWAAFPEKDNLVIINLSNLNSISVSFDKKTAIIGGGAKIHETIAAADAADVIVQTGNCNGAGVLGVLLGGGYGNTMGQVGFGVDTILEMRVVTASGEARTVTASQDPDLFWAMRGAGPNFGIVTSATVKAYPVAKDDRYAWCGALIYTDDKLERVVEAIQNLDLSARMVVFMYFGSSGPPSHAAMIIVTPWLYQGTAESGKAAFKTLYDIGPMVENTSVLPYTEWNTGANPFCAKDERKPACGAGLDRLDPQAWREVWDKYTEFQKKPSAQASVVLMEAYPLNDKRFADDVVPASFPYRGVRFNAAILPWYTDAGLDGEGLQCAKNIRELWTKSSGREVNATYINFAHGDEPLEEIYGDSLPRLRKLKHKWDPENRFNQWFNIQ